MCSRSRVVGTVVAALWAANVLLVSPVRAQEVAGGPPLLGLDLYMPVPEDNPIRSDVIELGRSLFFDPLLSIDSTFACATCHRPETGFTNRLTTSVGVYERQGTRNVPAILNRAYGRAFFWDGRITELEEQVLQPILAENEMAMTLDGVVTRLAASPRYSLAFRQVFSRPLSSEDLARALASYVRTIRAAGSPFDRFAAGDSTALTEREREGLELFQGKARCVRCHTGTNFTDDGFHNTGAAWQDGRLQDLGRGQVTGREEDRGAFKTPTLREVARTAPYMHDGSFETLRDVVSFYSDGGRVNPYQDDRIGPLDLSYQEKEALVAFLRALSGEIREGL